MKTLNLKLLFKEKSPVLLLSSIFCLFFLIAEYDSLQRHIGNYFLVYSVLSIGVSLVSFGFFVLVEKIKVQILAAALSPVFGSFIGYFAILCLNYFNKGVFLPVILGNG